MERKLIYPILTMIFCLFCLGAIGQDIDALKDKAKKADGIEKLKTLIAVADAHYNRNELEAARDWGDYSIELANNLGKKDFQAETMNYTSLDLIPLKADAYLILGKTYKKQGRESRANRHFRYALRFSEAIKYDKVTEEAKKEMEGLNQGAGNKFLDRSLEGLKSTTEELIEKVKESIDEEDEQKIYLVRGETKENLGRRAEEVGKPVKAIEHYEGAAELYQKGGDSIKVRIMLNRIASLYARLGNEERASQYADLSKGGDQEIDAILLESAAVKAPEEHAKDLEEMSDDLTTDIKSAKIRTDSLRLALEVHHAKGNTKEFKKSLQKYEESKSELDSLTAKNALMQSELLNTKQELELIELKRTEEKSFRNWLLFSLGLILSFLAILGILFVQRRRNHRKLQAAFSELDETHKQLKETQTQLVSSEKMASLGQLTAGIAHEINNPINFISGNIMPLRSDIEDILSILKKYEEAIEKFELEENFIEVEQLKKQLEIDYITEEITELISGIDEGAERTTEIVKGLRNFARMDENEIKAFDIHAGLDSTLSLLRNQLGDVQVLKDYSDIPKMEAFPGKLNQVFMNILTNALQAMPDGGILNIKTRSEDERVFITIRDTGIGMTEDVISRVFEPFFTTKPVGEGTGLGMSITHGIIQAHHGDIEIDSTPGQGTEITLSFPLKQLV
ncbi:MAG: ATP-binding protein [Bacteroidota bacterium]